MATNFWISMALSKRENHHWTFCLFVYKYVSVETSTACISASFQRILHCYLKHHVHHHAEARLPWILSRGVHGGKIEQRGARLLADGVHQHLLPYTWRPCQQDGFYQRAVLVEHLRTCRQRASDLYPINDTHFLHVTVWAAWLPYPVARLRTAIRSAARPSVTALARYHFASAWSRGSCSHLDAGRTVTHV